MKKRYTALLLALFLLAGCTQQEPPAAEVTQPVQEQVAEPAPAVPAEPVPTEPAPTGPAFTADHTPDSDPANWETQWQIITNGQITESYTREDEIFFDSGDYFTLPGVASFRGGNYRTDGSYGIADITTGEITTLWKTPVGYVSDPVWGGCCWTGQPLVVQWDEETKAIMNLYEEKKAKADLVEGIYAKADGYVHFIDMDDGSYTRDPLRVGMAFKGSGALDPRGYPILYVGSGLPASGKNPAMFAISLIDGSILYERSCYDEFSLRFWFGMDGAPLVDAETDTLIWGGENGLLYTIKLNTDYDPQAGTLTMAPEEPVMTRYSNQYTRVGRNAGYESSVTVAENYAFIGDNAGMLHCVDLNTMELTWAQYIVDDINATPLFDYGADGNPYLYVAPSMDYSRYGSELPICKVDATNGEILWTHSMPCGTMTGVPGGILASPLLGRTGSDMENLIVFSVGCSPTVKEGQVVALDKDTGEVIWQYETENYMWSSPVALYTEEGKGYIFQVDADGYCYLLEGATGNLVSSIHLDCTVEATPVAFGNRILLGSRTKMYLFEIS